MRQLNGNDPHFHIKLTSALVPLELEDDHGNVVGNYTPAITAEDLKANGAWPTDEELEQATKSTGRTYTTAEVIAHLRSLG